MNVLFVTWDGPGPNYLESLYLPIFSALQQERVGHFSVQQYAWDAETRSASIAEAAVSRDIDYRVRGVGPGPHSLATGAMMAAGGIDIARQARKKQVDVLMPRSIIPAAMCLVARRLLPDVKLLYDADGLMADERADFGGWSQRGLSYRLFRRVERMAIRRADLIVTRTRRSGQILAERSSETQAVMAKTFVTSNGRDDDLFSPGSDETRSRTRESLGAPPPAPLVVYAGSLGGQYLPARMLAFFEKLHRERRDARLLILTGAPDTALSLIEQSRVPKEACIVRSVHPSEVPAFVAAADLGLAFRVQCLSQQAVAPIKVGEYLLCGVPVFSSAGIGDLDQQIVPAVGKLAGEASDTVLSDGVRWFVDTVMPNRDDYRECCRDAGLAHFSLEHTAEQYRRAFERL